MSHWRFYQGLRSEWRWYHLDEVGNVIAESDQAFAELKACMVNAEAAGFTGDAYQVHARQSASDTLVEDGNTGADADKSAPSKDWNGSPPSGSER
jgi:hypothetical protein